MRVSSPSLSAGHLPLWPQVPAQRDSPSRCPAQHSQLLHVLMPELGTWKGHQSQSKVIRNQKGKTDSPKARGGGRGDSHFCLAQTPPPMKARCGPEHANPVGSRGRAGGSATPPPSCVSPGTVAVLGRGSPYLPACGPSLRTGEQTLLGGDSAPGVPHARGAGGK